MRFCLSLLLLLAALSAAGSSAAAAAAVRPVFAGSAASREKFRRTELYFGTAVPGGGTVTREEWQRFVNDEVTPRFPDGLTVLEGYGQYRGAGGAIVRENSFVLVLLYPKRQKREAGRKIEEIRALYKQRFAQESVLRLDFRESVETSF